MPALRKFLLLLVVLAALPTSAHATYSLPPDRTVDWKSAFIGVKGDIPTRSTIYASLNPSGGDDSAAIQAALNACPAGQVVYLKAGTFRISSNINIPSNVTLRGAGRSSTTIAGSSGMTSTSLISFKAGGGYSGTSYTSPSALSKGQTVVTLNSSPGWPVGSLVLIDSTNGSITATTVNNVGASGTCSWCGRSSGTRASGQVNRVAAVSGSTVTFETPLMWAFPNSSTQFTQINSVTSNAGMENLSVNNQGSGSSSQGGNGGTVIMHNASNCWLLSVDMNGSYMTMLRMVNCYGCTVRKCLLHEGVPAAFTAGAANYGTSRAYGIWIGPGSNCLVEDNQLYNLAMPVKLDEPTSYNVLAYNVITRILYSTNPTWNQAAIEFHGAHPAMNLFEGNIVAGRIDADNYWGSSSHNTFFRNRGIIPSGMSGALWDVCLESNAHHYNFVGNVLGTPRDESVFLLNNVTIPSSAAIFQTGYQSDGDNSASGNDADVFATLLLHGNWDSVHNATQWSSGLDQVLPASLYRSAIPSWWGGAPWPAIGPDVTPMYPDDSYTMTPGGANTPFDAGTQTASSFTITAGSSSGGSITPSGTSTLSAGANRSYTISPSSDYRIADVTVDGTSVGAVSAYTFTSIAANHTITANFAANIYSITASAGAGGSITPSGTATVSAGASKAYSITPATGYAIAGVTVDGAPVGAVSSYNFSNISANHTIQATFAATSGSGTTSAAAAYAVNAGGSKYMDRSGVIYGSDANFTGGTVSSTTAAIAGTSDGVLYQSERYGNFSYKISLPNGKYHVTLKFAETYFSVTGKRVFSVVINGATVISNLDLYARAGKNAAYDVVLPVTVSNGTLNIGFVSKINNAEVRAIKVAPAANTVFAANSGGSQFTSTVGVSYQADARYSGGSISTTRATISGTSDTALYQSERYGNFSYSIPVLNGNYNVRLKFAETYFSAAGQRIFSVAVNGTTMIANLDLYARAGKNAAYDIVVPVSVTNGVINLKFVSQVNNAEVRGILVEKI